MKRRGTQNSLVNKWRGEQLRRDRETAQRIERESYEHTKPLLAESEERNPYCGAWPMMVGLLEFELQELIAKRLFARARARGVLRACKEHHTEEAAEAAETLASTNTSTNPGDNQ